MSKTGKIFAIVFLIALAVIVYFIMFGKKNATTTATTTPDGQPLTAGTTTFPILREAGGVIDPAQRYIGTARPGITPTATT